jgi:hypothetical protein
MCIYWNSCIYELGKAVVVNGEILIEIQNSETLETEYISVKNLKQNLEEYGVIPF